MNWIYDVIADDYTIEQIHDEFDGLINYTNKRFGGSDE